MRQTLLLILVFLILVSPVLAVPPFQSTSDVGQLIVSVPKPEYVLQGSAFDFHIHVYNSSGHLQTNTTATCYLHVYNTTGHHVIIETMSFDTTTKDFFYDINSTTTANKGFLPFITWCNTTTQGGFYSGDLEINDATSVGITDDNSQGLSITFFILLATLIIFLLPKIYGTFTENKIVNLIITRCCYVIGFYLMVMNSGVFASIATNAGYAANEIFRYMWLFGIGGYLLMFVTGIKTLFDVVLLYQTLVKEKRGLK